MSPGEIAEQLLVARFHRWREPVELGTDGGAQPADTGGVEGHEHCGRAGLLCLTQRLAHPHPGGQRRRRGGHDRQSQLGRTAQDHRLLAQLGITAQRRDQSEMRVAGAEDAHLNLEPPRPPRPVPAR